MISNISRKHFIVIVYAIAVGVLIKKALIFVAVIFSIFNNAYRDFLDFFYRDFLLTLIVKPMSWRCREYSRLHETN